MFTEALTGKFFEKSIDKRKAVWYNVKAVRD